MTTEIKPSHHSGRVALVTGGSAGLGRALTLALADAGWTVITDARHGAALDAVRRTGVVAIPGDVTDADHRAELLAAVSEAGGLDLLVHNASTLGPLPLRPLADVTVADLTQVWRTNLGAPLVLTNDLLPALVVRRGILLAITSDAAADHYPTWGLYGASKSGLEHLVQTYAAENAEIVAYAVDPGDMRTAMHQDAFPGEDISDRPLPEEVVPRFLDLIVQRPPSGRYRAADLVLAALAGVER